MLERATGCLENAGQRLLWHSGDIVRSKRTLRPRFWHHGEIDIPAWCFLFLQSTHRVPDGRSLYRQARASAQDGSCHMHLDFLYPAHVRNTARNSEPRKHNLARKGGKLSKSSSRNYMSSPPEPFRERMSYSSSSRALRSAAQASQASQIDARLETGRVEATPSQRLSALLQLTDHRMYYDKVWSLYRSIDNREEFYSQVLRYLSSSRRHVDAERAREVLREIPAAHRNDRHYGQATFITLRAEKRITLAKELVREAILQGKGRRSWSRAFVYCVSKQRWADMIDLWDLKPADTTPGLIGIMANQRTWMRLVTHRLMFLTLDMEKKKVDLGKSSEIPKFLLHLVFRSRTLLRHMPIKTMLNLTHNLHNLGLLEPSHYCTAMDTLKHLADTHSADRCILLYRNYCWRMTSRPPNKMLHDMLLILHRTGTTDQVNFVLEEYRFFYGTVPPQSYLVALRTHATVGDVTGVDQVLEEFRREHNDDLTDPLYHYLPYLYVYARLGRVDETHARFRSLSVVGAEQSLHCWNVLLTAYTNAADFRGAFSVFDQIMERGFYNSHTFTNLMGMCAKRGDTDTIDALFKMAMDHGVSTHTSLIDPAVESCLKNGKLEEAERRAEAATRAGYAGGFTNMWNNIILHYAYRYDIISAMRIRQRMNDLGISPNTKTSSALILSLAMVGRTDDAREVLQEMRRNTGVRPTEFQYSILLRGYVLERNRSMVNVIYNEMQNRVKAPGIQGRLAILQANIQRDLRLHYEQGGDRKDPNIKMKHAERFLAQNMARFGHSRREKPFVNRLSAKHTYPNSYYEKLISTYGAKGAFERVDELLDQFSFIGQQGEHPVRLLAVLMHTYAMRGQHDQVCACWDMAFDRLTILASRSDKGSESLAKHSASSHPSAHLASHAASTSTPEQPFVYPAYSHSLYRCISPYIQALAHQNLHSKIPKVVQDIEKKGFTLSTQNWSVFVKMMASSENPEDQMRAFTVFEEKFMPNFLSWKNVISGDGKRPPGAPSRRDLVTGNGNKGAAKLTPRGVWVSIRPGFMQPTYTTMLYLASALLDFRERSIRDTGAEMKSLFDAAPKTFIALTEMPYNPDPFQAALIRGHEIESATSKPPQYPRSFVNTEGVLEVSRSRRNTRRKRGSGRARWIQKGFRHGARPFLKKLF